MIDDKDLITRVIANKDSHAFTSLVKKHQQNIRQFLRRITAGDWALADDLAQDTFLLAYQNLATFRGEANFTTWLHRIAYNRFLKSRQNYLAPFTLRNEGDPGTVSDSFERIK